MGFWDKVGKIVEVALEKAPDVLRKLEQETMIQKAGRDKQMEIKLKEYEHKVQKAESNNVSLSEEQKKKIKDAKETINKVKVDIYGSANDSNVRSIEEWDRKWICIGGLETANLTPYNTSVGLYRHVIGGKTMYVGRAIELNNGGFRKRLSDYRRDSNSARKHSSGRLINDNLSDITTYVLVVGDDESVQITRALEGKFIAKYKPEWNRIINI